MVTDSSEASSIQSNVNSEAVEKDGNDKQVNVESEEGDVENKSSEEPKVVAPDKICETPGCGKPAPLQCPKCLELKIKASNFCSQQCFKSYYAIHKKLHVTAGSVPGAKHNGLNSQDLIMRYATFKQTGTLLPYKQTPMRKVPQTIEKPDYADDPRGVPHSEVTSKRSGQIQVLSEREIAGVRRACELGREVLEVAAKLVKVGVTTEEIDRAVHDACVERDCYPSPLNYYNFPKSCCTSVNEVVCHGIPDLRPLQEGDIVNIDISVYHKGFHGDLNETYFVGTPDEESLRLVTTSFECLDLAIKGCRPGMRYRDVGNIIQKHAQNNKCSVVRTYCGHGIHQFFHCAPTIPHYAKNKAIGVMRPGHCFTIEPMINAGKFHDELWPDNWTSVTCDGKRSAQFEHTLLVTEDGIEILTKRPDGLPPAHFMQQIKDLGVEPFETVK